MAACARFRGWKAGLEIGYKSQWAESNIPQDEIEWCWWCDNLI